MLELAGRKGKWVFQRGKRKKKREEKLPEQKIDHNR